MVFGDLETDFLDLELLLDYDLFWDLLALFFCDLDGDLFSFLLCLWEADFWEALTGDLLFLVFGDKEIFLSTLFLVDGDFDFGLVTDF